MTVWLWVIVGLAAFLVLSTATALAIAAILGQIGREVSDLFESQPWTAAPLAREAPLATPARKRTPDDPSVEESRAGRVVIIA